ncbi:MAG: Clp protease N-terminal domain-containing protein, partial [Glutamicibacter ardleyensis]
EPARLVLVLAQQAATARNEGHLGTEHLLLALLRMGDGRAFQCLKDLGVNPHQLRQRIIMILSGV